MTAPAATPDVIWYEPEFPDNAAVFDCYCRETAHGRTHYWDGYQHSFRYQCRKHLPSVGAVYEAVPK